MKQRTKTAVVILLTAVTLLIFSEYIVYPIALALLSVVSLYEMFNVIGVTRKYFLVIPAYLYSLSLPIVAFFVKSGETRDFLTLIAALLFAYNA